MPLFIVNTESTNVKTKIVNQVRPSEPPHPEKKDKDGKKLKIWIKMIKMEFGMMDSIKRKKKIMIDNGEMFMLKKARVDLVYLMFRVLGDGYGVQLGNQLGISMNKLKMMGEVEERL